MPKHPTAPRPSGSAQISEDLVIRHTKAKFFPVLSIVIAGLGLSACTDTYNMTYNTYYGDEYYSVPVVSHTNWQAQPSVVQAANHGGMFQPTPQPDVLSSSAQPSTSQPVEHMPEVVISSPLTPLEKPATSSPSDAARKHVGKAPTVTTGSPEKLSIAATGTSGDSRQAATLKRKRLVNPNQGESTEASGGKSASQPPSKAVVETADSEPLFPEQSSKPASAQHTQIAAVSPAKKRQKAKKLQAHTSQVTTYIVRKGDTSFGIARRHGMTVDDLADLNKLGADYSVFAGQKLKVRAKKVEDTAIVAGDKIKKADESRRAALRKIKTPARSGEKLAWPVIGKVVERYGSKPDGRYVEGVRLSTAPGTPVRAAENGVVVFRDRLTNNLKTYGQVLIIKHDGGQATVYSGISDVVPEIGAIVKRGDVIGKISESKELMFVVSDHKGKMSDPMLHLERRRS